MDTTEDESMYSFGSVKSRQSRRSLPPIRHLTLPGHVGLTSLPDQLLKSVSRNGFVFNLLCVGETGLGKSSLVDCLFNTGFEYRARSHRSPEVELDVNTYDLCESNVNLKLTVVNTVGYGDQINREDNFRPILEYIDAQFETYAEKELGSSSGASAMKTYRDTRIHACLYFICPTGRSLKNIDIACIKALGSKCNVIPIIAKADTIAKYELQQFKDRILMDIEANKLKVYQFPTDDESVSDLNALMNVHQPFAVVVSKDFVKVGKRRVRGREYPWGVVLMENEKHSDFVKLREMLIRTNMNDLIETTHTKHYSLFKTQRSRRLMKDIERLKDLNDEPYGTLPAMKLLMRTEFKTNYQNKVAATNGKLKAAELKIERKFAKLKLELEKQAEVLSKEKSKLHYEIEVFDILKSHLPKLQSKQSKQDLTRRNKFSCFPSQDGDSG